MVIDRKYLKTDTVYKNIGTNTKEGQLGCGFMSSFSKNHAAQKVNFQHYGAFLVLKGNGTYISDEGEEYPLVPGCFVQRIPGVEHTTIVNANEEWLEFFVIFGKETYDTMEHIGLLNSSPVLNPGLDEIVFGKCVSLLNTFKQTVGNENSLLYVGVLQFVLNMYQRSSQADGSYRYEKDYNKIVKAERLLCQNPENRMSAKMIAESLGMGYESFRKKFKNIYQVSPNTYQLNYRINYGKTLLADAEKTIEEIAVLCGFSDGFAFSKAFKNRCGISPEQFRKSM